MYRIRWRVVLPIVHLALASTLFFTGWYQYRAALRHTNGIGLEYILQHKPAPVQRIAYGVSFPAFVLSNLAIIADHAGFHTTLFSWSIESHEFYFEVGDGVFFLAVIFLWYWVGLRLDRNTGCSDDQTGEKSGYVTIARLALAFLFAGAVGYAAIAAVNDYRRPIRQIGAFGLVWASLLAANFVWCLIRAQRIRVRQREFN